MWDLMILPILLFGWFALFRWALPAIGIPTCLSGKCGSSIDPPAMDLKSDDGFVGTTGQERPRPGIESSGRVAPSAGVPHKESLR